MGILDKMKKKQSVTDHMYLYTEEELDQYEKFVMENFGDYKNVFHEIASPDIHLDVIVILPTKSNPYYTLVTMGMGAYKMNVPKEWEEYELERAELVLYLPPTWNIQSNREEDYWPLRQLKVMARLPIEQDTWLGYGHTVSSSQENEPYASNTKLCSMMLLNSVGKDYQKLDLRMKTIGKINFYQLFPLYKEELEFQMRRDIEALFNLFDDADMMPIVNINRKNYCVDTLIEQTMEVLEEREG